MENTEKLIPSDQVEGEKDQRILKLAQQFLALLRGHSDRWEALEAMTVAKTMFRLPDGESYLAATVAARQSLSGDRESLSVAQ